MKPTLNDKATTVQELKDTINKFIKAREWDQFHNPKNLSMQIAAEAAELMEHFLWVDDKESSDVIQKNMHEVEQEIADIVIGVLCLSNSSNIDLSAAIERKMAINAQRYPVEKAKGRTEKYTKL